MLFKNKNIYNIFSLNVAKGRKNERAGSIKDQNPFEPISIRDKSTGNRGENITEIYYRIPRCSYLGLFDASLRATGYRDRWCEPINCHIEWHYLPPTVARTVASCIM